MIRAKAVDPRNGRPSWNRLAELADIGPSTISGMVQGTKRTSAATISKVAAALGVNPEDVSTWLGITRPVRARYVPPAEADLLTDRQRSAVTELIRAFVAEERAGDGDGNATPTRQGRSRLSHVPSHDEPALVMGRIEHGSATAFRDLGAKAAEKGWDVVVAFSGDEARIGLGEGARATAPPDVAVTTDDAIAALDGYRATPGRYALAARAGTPDHAPDTTTGEHSQDDGGFDPA